LVTIPLAARSAVAWLVVAALAACTRPPALSPVEGPVLDEGTAAPADCDAPPVANEPEGCHDDAARPPGAPPAERPGDDRDADGVEDLLDACPDRPAAPGDDSDGDGCADAPAPDGA
jgi:hypothetical protein